MVGVTYPDEISLNKNPSLFNPAVCWGIEERLNLNTAWCLSSFQSAPLQVCLKDKWEASSATEISSKAAGLQIHCSSHWLQYQGRQPTSFSQQINSNFVLSVDNLLRMAVFHSSLFASPFHPVLQPCCLNLLIGRLPSARIQTGDLWVNRLVPGTKHSENLRTQRSESKQLNPINPSEVHNP